MLEPGRALTALAAGAAEVPGSEDPSLGGTDNLGVLHKWQRCHQRLLQPATARLEMTGEKERD